MWIGITAKAEAMGWAHFIPPCQCSHRHNVGAVPQSQAVILEIRADCYQSLSLPCASTPCATAAFYHLFASICFHLCSQPVAGGFVGAMQFNVRKMSDASSGLRYLKSVAQNNNPCCTSHIPV